MKNSSQNKLNNNKHKNKKTKNQRAKTSHNRTPMTILYIDSMNRTMKIKKIGTNKKNNKTMSKTNKIKFKNKQQANRQLNGFLTLITNYCSSRLS